MSIRIIHIEKLNFHVPTYFGHFKNAVNEYIRCLEDGTQKLSLMKQALKNKPELV